MERSESYWVATESQIIQIGKKAPDFELKNLAGHTIKLSDFTGKQNVALFFFRHFR